MLGFFYGMFSGMVATISNQDFEVSHGGGSMWFSGSDLPFMRGSADGVTIGSTTHYRGELLDNAKIRCRLLEHEAWHVRQYQRWGPLFLAVYVAYHLIQGKDNWLEQEAYAAEEVCE